MAPLEVVPVIDVQNDNIHELWPTMLLAVRTSTFVALDMELSGLGNRRELNAKEIDTRFKALSNISRTRSVISVGLSCFKLKDSSCNVDDTNSNQASSYQEYVAQTFNILMLCSEEYVVEPLSLRFLVNHNFDFNRQYAKGIPYHRGPDQAGAKDRQWLRELFAEIFAQSIPVVFHNAYVDLGFLYQSFHTALPSKMAVFLADLSELFPGGVFDTKYITEYQARFQASYLEYVFRKCQRDNRKARDDGKNHISISTLKYPSPCWYITYLPCGELPTISQVVKVCDCYAAHGWCSRGIQCEDSHDINHILDNDEKYVHKKKNKKNRRKRKLEEAPKQPFTKEEPAEQNMDGEEAGEENIEGGANGQSTENQVGKNEVEMESDTDGESAAKEKVPENKANVSRTEGHRAGFDSFMTGFIFASFIERFSQRNKDKAPGGIDGMSAFRNKVALGGKDFPLSIVQSPFTKTSKEHIQRLTTIRSGT